MKVPKLRYCENSNVMNSLKLEMFPRKGPGKKAYIQQWRILGNFPKF